MYERGVLCNYMRYFLLHLRKEDGTPYPPSSIRSILSGLNRAMEENGVPFCMKNKEDPAFFLSYFLHWTRLRLLSYLMNMKPCFGRRNCLVMILLSHYSWLFFWGVGLKFVLHGVEEQHSLQPKQFK